MQAGTEGKKAREWLLNFVLLERLKKASYSKVQFPVLYNNIVAILDNFEHDKHQLFPAKKEKISTIRRIGYYQNSNPSSQNLTSASKSVSEESGSKKKKAKSKTFNSQASSSKRASYQTKAMINDTTTASRASSARSQTRRQVKNSTPVSSTAQNVQSRIGKKRSKSSVSSAARSKVPKVYHVNRFLRFDFETRKLHVEWKEDVSSPTWEPMMTLKEDLGDSFSKLWEPFLMNLTLPQVAELGRNGYL